MIDPNVANIINTNLNISKSCSVHYNDSKFCKLGIWVSGADQDIRIYIPEVNYDEYFITMSAIQSGDTQEATIVITGGPSDAFAVPTGFIQTWIDRDSGGDQNILFAQPIAPNGYTCLGDAAWEDKTGGYNQWAAIHDNLYGYRCINNKYLVQDVVTSHTLWTDAGSGADYDGAVKYTTHQMQFGDSSIYTIKLFELIGNMGGTPRTTFYKFNPANTFLHAASRNESNFPWIGLRQSVITNKWPWLDQTELNSDIITMENDIVMNSGQCSTLSTRLLSTSTKTTFVASDCDENKKYFICETSNNGNWNADEKKSFLVTVEPNLFDEVILVSFENTGNNAICIDELSVNKQT